MIKIRNENGIRLKLLDLMNFAPPQSLEKFVQNFGGKGCEIKGIFPYEEFNSCNYMQILNETVSFEYKQFYSNLKNSIVTLEQYHEHLKDRKEKEF
jgi:hypothetical protein